MRRFKDTKLLRMWRQRVVFSLKGSELKNNARNTRECSAAERSCAAAERWTCRSFTAKRRSALPQEVPNKDREMETHRNRSLCSHDLIRHGGAELSGSSAACCTDGKSKSNLWGDGESARIMPLSRGAAPPRRHIDSGQRKSGVVPAIYCESLI